MTPLDKLIEKMAEAMRHPGNPGEDLMLDEALDAARVLLREMMTPPKNIRTQHKLYWERGVAEFARAHGIELEESKEGK